MRGIAGLLGWIAVWGYVIALLNYFMKYINKKYTNKIPKEKERYKKIYRLVMRYVVRYHKVAGAVASIINQGYI